MVLNSPTQSIRRSPMVLLVMRFWVLLLIETVPAPARVVLPVMRRLVGFPPAT